MYIGTYMYIYCKYTSELKIKPSILVYPRKDTAYSYKYLIRLLKW